jgi:hypothetical protein
MDEENEYGHYEDWGYDDVNDWETEQVFQDQEREYDDMFADDLETQYGD